ncbi:expressed unknown protein [Seminavis robusta]|uniref:Uncharacterized protein n=1 Tax=Seminavis robusta TaxID=568900 RepID=A0A9N8H814_9STRA|nr:expressed unknown protein [Seminavis robusta]|eukprot:Sro145_g067371.1  (113) ;mRNA; f:79186-79524
MVTGHQLPVARSTLPGLFERTDSACRILSTRSDLIEFLQHERPYRKFDFACILKMAGLGLGTTALGPSCFDAGYASMVGFAELIKATRQAPSQAMEIANTLPARSSKPAITT